VQAHSRAREFGLRGAARSKSRSSARLCRARAAMQTTSGAARAHSRTGVPLVRRHARLLADERTRHAAAPWRRACAEPGDAHAGGGENQEQRRPRPLRALTGVQRMRGAGRSKFWPPARRDRARTCFRRWCVYTRMRERATLAPPAAVLAPSRRDAAGKTTSSAAPRLTRTRTGLCRIHRGAGGMGEAYRASDTRPGRDVAVI